MLLGWGQLEKGPRISLFLFFSHSLTHSLTHSIYISPTLVLTSVQVQSPAEDKDQLPKLPAACQGLADEFLDFFDEGREGVVPLTEHAPVDGVCV